MSALYVIAFVIAIYTLTYSNLYINFVAWYYRDKDNAGNNKKNKGKSYRHRD